MNNHKIRRRGRGFTLIEVLIAVNVMIVGLLGFDSALKSAQVQVRFNQEANRAEVEILSAVEEFRSAWARDLDATVAAYKNGVARMFRDSLMGDNVRLTARLVLDEHENEEGGDSRFADAHVAPAAARPAVLQLTVTWDGILGPREIRHVSPVPKQIQR